MGTNGLKELGRNIFHPILQCLARFHGIFGAIAKRYEKKRCRVFRYNWAEEECAKNRLYEELMQWDQGNRNGISSRSHLSSKLILNNFNLRSGYFNVDFRFVHLVRPQNFPKN